MIKTMMILLMMTRQSSSSREITTNSIALQACREIPMESRIRSGMGFDVHEGECDGNYKQNCE